MAFPTTPPPTVTDLLINGSWTVVNDGTSVFRRRALDGLTITRGRGDWSSRVVASRCAQVFENADGYFSNRLPTSVNYGLLGRNTQMRHRIRWVLATFAVTVSAAWPAADTGQTWTNSGGAASDYASSSGVGQHIHTAVNSLHTSIVETNATDQDVTVDTAWPGLNSAAGASAGHWVCARFTDGNNYYTARLFLTTGGGLSLGLLKRVAGVLTGIDGGAVVVGTGHVAADWWTIRISVRGNRVRAMAWLRGTPAPTSWQIAVTDTDLTTGTKAALLSRLETGNTNTLNVTASWDNFEANDFRFWGETPAFAPQWNVKGSDVTVPVEAAGILQRLSGPRPPEQSTLYRAMIGVNSGDFVPVAYWPHEDGSSATQAASAFSGQPAAVFGGTVTPAAYDGFAGSLPLPTLDNGTITGQFPAYTDNDVWETQFTMMIPSTLSGSGSIYSLALKPGNSVREFRVTYQSGDLFMQAFGPTGTELVNATITAAEYQRDTPYLAAWIDFLNSGTSTRHVQFLLRDTNGVLADFIDFQPDGGGAGTPGVADRWQVQGVTGTTGGWSFGHHALFTDVGLYTAVVITPNAQAAGGYAGELAGNRLTRLCREHGIPFELIGDATDTKSMGPQRVAKLVDLLFDCADVDQGILYEPRDAFGLAYRTGASLYNQTGPSVSYTSGKLAPPFQPAEDEQLLVNDVTVKRIGGSSARVTVDDGPLSTQEPPDGVGTVDIAPEVNLYTDDQPLQLAGWLAHLGSWDEARYPMARFAMAAPDLVADTTLSAQLAALDLGDVFTVTDLPSWQPPDPAGLMVQGTTEYVGDGKDWALSFNCVPSGPYATGVYDTARYDSDFTTTAEALDTTETGVDITVTAGMAGWVTTASNPAEFPFGITIGGEDMTVTASTSTGAGTYTLTVTRSANGVVKSHATGAPVHVADPGYYSY